MPNFQNPTGKTYSLARRRQIQQFLQQQDSLLAVEDDPYGALRFTEEQWPTLAELAPDKVLRLCSFSKTVAPSFRLGWVQGPAPVLSQLAKFKQVADLHSSCILQYQLLCFLQSGYLAQQVAKVRQVYGKRCQLMVDAVQTQLSAWVNLVPPKGGMFIWCEQGLVDSMRLFKECVQHRVAFVPGQAFYPQLDETELDRATPQRGMRLNFSHTSEANIAEGVHRIAKVLQSFG